METPPKSRRNGKKKKNRRLSRRLSRHSIAPPLTPSGDDKAERRKRYVYDLDIYVSLKIFFFLLIEFFFYKVLNVCVRLCCGVEHLYDTMVHRMHPPLPYSNQDLILDIVVLR